MKSVAVLFALALVVAPAAASAQISDTTPPTLVMPGSGFDPLAIDLTAGPVNVTVTLHLKDDLSGVSFDYQQYSQAGIVFRSPTGNQAQRAIHGAFSPTSGDSLEGVWQAVSRSPSMRRAGDWYVESLTLVDKVGNVATLDATLLASMGFPTTLTVTSVEDTTPPTLVDFALSPPSVDTSAGSAEVKVTMHITDAVSGVDFGPNPNVQWIMGFSSPSGKLRPDLREPDPHLRNPAGRRLGA